MSENITSSVPEAEQPVQRRAVYRRHLVFYLRIFNQEDNTIFGHVVDLSPIGLMVLTEKEVSADKVYKLRMSLPALTGERHELLFDADCRWCKEDGNPDFYLSGFQISELLDHESERLKELVRDYGFGEPT